MTCREKSIKSLCIAQSILIDKQKDLLNELVIFYESLYSDNHQCCEKDCCDYTRTLSLSNINEATLHDCEKSITDNECQNAIFQLSSHKSPGLVAFPLHFI